MPGRTGRQRRPPTENAPCRSDATRMTITIRAGRPEIVATRRPAGIRRLLVIKPSSLGDIVQSFWALSVLRHAFPHARIAWLARSSYASFLRSHPHIDCVFTFDRYAKGISLVRDQLRLAHRLRQFGADVCIDLQGLARSGWFCLLSGAPRRIGMSDCREGARLAYNRLVRIPPDVTHAIDRYLVVARHVAGVVPATDVVLPQDSTAEDWAHELVGRLGGAPIVVAPGARWETKRMPVEWFAEVTRQLVHRTGKPVVILGSVDEAELAMRLRELLGNATRCLNLCGRTSLLQTTELLRRSSLLIGNDSGPAHLAAAARCPVVVAFTCTDPARAAPRGAPVAVLQATVPCCASYLKQCHSLACRSTIPIDKAVEAGQRLLRPEPVVSAA